MPATLEDAAAAILLELGPLEPADLAARVAAAGGTKRCGHALRGQRACRQL